MSAAAEPNNNLGLLDDLTVRLLRAERELRDMARDLGPSVKDRLAHKADGVRLALSYVEEAIRLTRSAGPLKAGFASPVPPGSRPMTDAAEPNVVPLAHRREGGHWLVFSDVEPVELITGCHCGFVADPGDHGYGDSVLDHFELEVRADERASRTRSRFTPDEATLREHVIAANERADRLAGRIIAAERAIRSGQSSTVVLAILGGSDEQEERA